MKKNLFFLIIGMFFLFLVNVQFTEAANGDVVITYDDELSGGLTGAAVTINCNGSDATCTDGNTVCDNDAVGGTITLYSASSTLVTAACETDTETITKLEVAKDGYVTTTNIDDSVYNTGAQNDESAALNFGYKITLQDEKTTPGTITSAAVTAGENDTSCTYNTNYYYCPVPLADDDSDADVDAVLAGYVTKNWDNVLGGTRDIGTNPQVGVTVTDMQFSQTIVITTEAVAVALTGATVTAGSGATSCSEDDSTSGTYWCAVPYDEDGTANDVSITLDGYVTHTAGDTVDRADNAAGQGAVTVNDVQYAVKITVLSGATVTTGNSYGTTCTEGSNYYCAVPLADTETNVRVVKTGYNTKTELNAWIDRTSDTDAQATCALSLVAETVPVPRPPGSRRRIKEKPIEELKAKITEILAKISQLRAQLQQLSGGEILEVPLEISADYRFTVNLEYGQKGDDVRYLQVFLKAQGLEIYPEGLVTGYFGPLTQAAVIRFQEKYRDDILAPWEITEGTGFVGKTTRVKLNELLGR